MDYDGFGPHVWRGSGGGRGAANVVPTGFPALDRELPGGGWPQGALVEICPSRYGIGELGLLIPALAWLSRQDSEPEPRWIAWIAPPLLPYAPALRRAGIDVERLLMIRPASSQPSTRDCLWAIEQVIRSGASIAVLAWPPAADPLVLRRLQLAAEAQRCFVVLFREPAVLAMPSPAALRVQLRHASDVLRVEILKCRGGRPAVVEIPEARPQ